MGWVEMFSAGVGVDAARVVSMTRRWGRWLLFCVVAAAQELL
jgi:hypothetical protein